MNMAQTISERVTALAHSVRVDLRQGMSVVGLYILLLIVWVAGRGITLLQLICRAHVLQPEHVPLCMPSPPPLAPPLICGFNL